MNFKLLEFNVGSRILDEYIGRAMLICHAEKTKSEIDD